MTAISKQTNPGTMETPTSQPSTELTGLDPILQFTRDASNFWMNAVLFAMPTTWVWTSCTTETPTTGVSASSTPAQPSPSKPISKKWHQLYNGLEKGEEEIWYPGLWLDLE